VHVVPADAPPPVTTVVVELTLTNVTAASFTDAKKETLLSEFAALLGVQTSECTLEFYYLQSESFRVMATGDLAVRVLVNLTSGGEASQVTSFLNQATETDTFILPSFGGASVNTAPAPLPVFSSSSSGVASGSSSSSGVVVAVVTQGSNSFQWSSLNGGLAIAAIVIAGIIVIALITWRICAVPRSSKQHLETSDGMPYGTTGEGHELVALSYDDHRLSPEPEYHA